MFFISVNDFFTKANDIPNLTEEEKKFLGQKLAKGDKTVCETLITSYFPLIAAYIKKAPKEIQTLDTVYTCIASLEKGVDSFDFSQNTESFVHHLSWRLRQCITLCIAKK